MKEINAKDYSILLGDDTLDALLAHLIERSYSQVFVLVDENTEKCCLPIVSQILFDIKIIRITSGESNKNITSTQLIWNELLQHKADRQSVLINLGGGVLGDLGGFAAATYKRGIDYIQVPTTLLAMVDSSIGGKTGIDYNTIKNCIGTIQPPAAVYIYPRFLKTLPEREILSGLAEIIKHALIDDEAYWEYINKLQSIDSADLEYLILESIKIKSSIVKKDPFEQGERKLLNFGHTIGHAIEAYSLLHDKAPLIHGEAIAIGMLCEAYLSNTCSELSSKELQAIEAIVLKFFPKYSFRDIQLKDVIELMYQDKKNNSDGINFTFLKRIGKGKINNTCNESQITLALHYYDSL